jgi:predicted acylesterase/phospholipase RssA
MAEKKEPQSKPAGSEKDAAVKASAPDLAAVIKGIETVKNMALSAPTATSISDAMDTIKVLAANSPDARSAANEAIKVLAASTGPATAAGGKPTKAICLGGGGPAAGLHIGALEGLKNKGVKFDGNDSVWALSCIGAWVGIIYNQATEGKEIDETYDFFRDLFRDDDTFKSFPVNTIFSPNWSGSAEAMRKFLFDLNSYRDAFLPKKMLESFVYTLSVVGNPKNWGKFNEGDFNRWTLNHVMAVHPVVRFLSAMAYKSAIDGKTKLHYPDSSFIKGIKIDRLFDDKKPYIFHNAFNFKKEDIDLFGNKWPATVTDRKRISAASLCACSALPFIEQTVEVDGKVYCEGALVDTVNFKNLLEDHGDSLQEIWINRIVDTHQIHQPQNMHDALANLCQLFAATVGEDDVKLFKHHARANNRSQNPKDPKWKGAIIEIQVDDHIDFHWSHKNLDRGREYGARRAEDALKLYNMYKDVKERRDGILIIPDDLSDDEITRAGVALPLKRRRDLKAAG